ncbi:LutC/YkgG family protein [Scopulibacillus cellulosilyticus]|uniref:Lactate utilization protein C n=1 Tax=Scopulibacillus cellulosilyticus TaxID=2665665 RepID=A0ABW2Q081_9BACL
MTKGTIQNQEAFLNKIAGKLGRERRTSVERPKWHHQPQWNVYKDASQDELLNIFKKACEAIHTDVHETQASSLQKVLDNVISENGGGPVIIPDDQRFKEYGILLNEKEVHVWDITRGSENIEIAKKANTGITFSDITLSESGTVTLFNDKYIARSISLLPAAYIAIVPKSSLVPRMTQAYHTTQDRAESGEAVATCINMISGPSNSADIEMNLVVGVHGPIKATYIVVTDL